MGLTPIESYVDNLTPQLCICNSCGRHVSPTRANLWRGQGGCKYCAGKSIDVESIDRVFLDAKVQPLEPYLTSTTPRLCLCSQCGNKVSPRYTDLRRGQGGCIFCAGNFPKDPGYSVLAELYVDQALTAGEVGEVLGLASTTVLKYLHVHDIATRGGYEKYGCERPSNQALEQWYIIDGMTSDEVGKLCNASSRTIVKWLREAEIPVRKGGASHGIYCEDVFLNNPELASAHAYLYLVRFVTDTEEYLKIGIGRCNSRRVENHRYIGGKVVQIRYGTLYDCFSVEQQIFRDFGQYRYAPKNPRMLGGKTECFVSSAPIDLGQYRLE